MRTIYIDELFLLNFAVDYIILYLTATFSALPYRRMRLLLGAAVGALYSVAAYFAEVYGVPIVSSLTIKLAAGAVMLLCAFGYASGAAFIRRGVIMLITSFLLGGLAYAAGLFLGGSVSGGAIQAPLAVRAVLIAAALALELCGAFSRGGGRELTSGRAEVSLTYNGRKAEFSALLDSGNLLRDPLDGSPVIVCTTDAVAPLFDRDELRMMRESSAVELVAALGLGGGWRLIPCATAAGSAMLAAFRPTEAAVDGERVRVMVAMSPKSLGALPALVGDMSGAKISGREVTGVADIGKAS